jgi:hypothetical protein
MTSKDQDNLSKIYNESSFYGISLSNDKEQLADYQHPNAASPALTFSKTANGPGAGKHTSVMGAPGYHSNEETVSSSIKYKVGDIIFGKLDWGGEDIPNFYKIDKVHSKGIFSFVSWYKPNNFLEGEWVEEPTIWKDSEDLDEGVAAGNIVIYSKL